MLYDLLISDSNLYLLNSLITKSLLVGDLFEDLMEYGFSSMDELSALVDMVCKCKKDGIRIKIT